MLLGWSPWALAGEPADNDEGTDWSVATAVGVQEVASRDELGSPLGYHGWNAPLVIRVDAHTQRWSAGGRLDGVVAGVNAPDMRTNLAGDSEVGHRASPIFADLSGWLLWPVAEPGDHRLSAGVGLGHWTFFRTYAYDPAQIGSVETWEAVLSADLRARLERTYDRWRWSVGTAFSLGARVFRPSHALRGDERIILVDRHLQVLTYGGWASLNRLQMMQVDGGVEWQLNPRWSLIGHYRVGYLSYRNELSTRAFRQQWTVGTRFNFH